MSKNWLNNFGLISVVTLTGVVALTSLAGCQSSAEGKADDQTVAQIAQNEGAEPVAAGLETIEQKQEYAATLLREIGSLVSTQSCASNDDCALLAVGHKPCGGPDEYRVYSKLSTDAGVLKAKAKLYRSLKESIQKEQGTMGICMVTPKPVFHCSNQQCQLDANSADI
ncbi:hypothetical protein [Pleionea litopenaei]|uniref:Lipoprotein n=1 Tax=Pleionea litopenaei TaxID=3070815 RepID=A0AA51X802_9GAMM|nr:hypothetical protein [Pleionea sp. HL-JVS1]WMS88434.1 hypothetical protein Q9312_05840 [Pleionea sp. HL-JVS1]